MKYALIGCGRISPNHLAAAKNNGLDIVAVSDLVPERMAERLKVAGLSGVAHTYVSYQEMIEKEKPELVAIATESGKHAAIALDCIREGCHVIIEKPVALSLKDAQSIVEEAERMDVRVCVCHQNRFNKAIQKIREAVENNQFGRMFYATAQIRWNRNENYYKQAPWRGTWEQDGGALMNQCIHNIDLLRWMMGDEIEEVIAYTDRLNHPYIAAEDLGIALIRFKKGGYGIIEGTTNIYPRNLEETLCLFGEKGTVKAGGRSVNILEEWLFSETTEDRQKVLSQYSEDPPNIYGFGHTPLYADMIDAIQQHREPYVDVRAGYRALELVLGVYYAAAEGKGIRFPLHQGTTMDFIHRF